MRLTASHHKIEKQPFHLQETEKLTPFAFPLWAERLQATHKIRLGTISGLLSVGLFCFFISSIKAR